MPLAPRSPRPRILWPSVSTTTFTSRSGHAASRSIKAPCSQEGGLLMVYTSLDILSLYAVMMDLEALG